jgi:putative restriction endonuclease
LRADLHILFDTGFITVDSNYRIEVSKRIKEVYQNGKDYYALDGKGLKNIPERVADRPSREFIEWHNNHVFTS